MDNQRILIDAGLSEEQAFIYDTLLEKGPQKASAIAVWTGIKRSTVYKVLEQLVSMNLVSQKGGKGTVASFSPNHPSTLLSSFEQKEKELAMAKNLLGEALSTLSSKFNLLSGKPNVQFYEGVEGMQKVYTDILFDGKDIMLIRSPYDDKFPEIIPIVEKQIKDQVSKNIHTRAITPLVESTKNTIANKDKENLVTRHMIKLEDFNEKAQIIIYGDQKVGITSFEDKMISTIIDNKAIHSAFKALFEFMWSKSTEDNKKIIESLGF